MDIDQQKLQEILATRQSYMWPYHTAIDGHDMALVNRWIKENCKGDTRQLSQFNGKILYQFNDENDHMLFTLTWAV